MSTIYSLGSHYLRFLSLASQTSFHVQIGSGLSLNDTFVDRVIILWLFILSF
jgi:hypothetical protein